MIERIARWRSADASAWARAVCSRTSSSRALLRPLALADVLDLHEQRAQLAVVVARDRERQLRGDLAALGVDEALLDVVGPAAPAQQLAPLLGVERDVVGMGDRVDRAPEQHALAHAEDVAQRLVDLLDRAVLVEARHADRRELERRAQQLLGAVHGAVGLVELEEHADLGPQQLGVVRLEDVVDRAGLVAAEDVVALLGDRRHEDDRDVPGLAPALDVLGGLEAVELGHLDVEQDERELVVQQPAQRLLAGRRGDQAAVQRGEDRLEREQVLGPVVDQQDVRLVAAGRRAHRAVSFPHASQQQARDRRRGRPRRRASSPRAPRAASRGRSAVAGSCTIVRPPRRCDRGQAGGAVGVRAGEQDAERARAVARRPPSRTARRSTGARTGRARRRSARRSRRSTSTW